MTATDAQILGHWYHVLNGLQYSTIECYDALSEALQARGIPQVNLGTQRSTEWNPVRRRKPHWNGWRLHARLDDNEKKNNRLPSCSWVGRLNSLAVAWLPLCQRAMRRSAQSEASTRTSSSISSASTAAPTGIVEGDDSRRDTAAIKANTAARQSAIEEVRLIHRMIDYASNGLVVANSIKAVHQEQHAMGVKLAQGDEAIGSSS